MGSTGATTISDWLGTADVVCGCVGTVGAAEMGAELVCGCAGMAAIGVTLWEDGAWCCPSADADGTDSPSKNSWSRPSWMSKVPETDVRGSKYDPEAMSSNGVSEEVPTGLLLTESGSSSSLRKNSSSQFVVERSAREGVGWSTCDSPNTAWL